MSTVTQHIANIKQPHGGYVPVREFMSVQFDDGYILGEENIHASIVGLAVDYLTRYFLCGNVVEAFEISLRGAALVHEQNKAETLLKQIRGLNSESIVAACKLSGYDVYYRTGRLDYRAQSSPLPDSKTIDNIRIMVNRSLAFWDQNGPIVLQNFTFEGGYTENVTAGDGDYLTKDTLWDMKVSKNPPNSKQTLQLLMYYLMGRHSVHCEFNTVTRLGIFNPRLNRAYYIDTNSISQDVIDEVNRNVIGYQSNEFEAANQNFGDEQACCNRIDENVGITLFEAAEILGVSKKKIKKLIIKGLLYAYQIDGDYFVPIAEINEYIDYESRIERIRIKAIISAVIVFVVTALVVLRMVVPVIG